MIADALNAALIFTSFCVVLAMLMATLRLLLGPKAQDRVISLDMLYVCGMILMVLQGMRHQSVVYFELALLIAALGFAGSMAMAKFLLRGEVIE
ncbi:hypothetical protein PSEWESI4_01410 [Pseudomonas carbonaria]|uniref:Multisubunit potassium/proton antiporter, PhaF subunit n=1 Tax=Zestomonas carbonaria TaxID=2762745 RepID=A0A7U7I8B1_9GAMM|nr:hypothetical protein PSEWESI4_01410 [Pseudomonas carbonaria]